MIRKAGIRIITRLINQIITEEVTPAEWKLCSTVDCYKRKEIHYGEETTGTRNQLIRSWEK